MVKIAQTKQFKNKAQQIEYINSRISNFTRKQKQNSGLSNLFNKKVDELDYIVEKIYKQRLKAVTVNGKEEIVTVKKANQLYKQTPQYQTKVKRNALKASRTQDPSKLLKTTNALAVHLTQYGFTVQEALWLIAKFGDRMARWRIQITSGEKEEIFMQADDPQMFLQRYIE